MDSAHNFDEQLSALASYLAARREAILRAWRKAIDRDPEMTTGASLPILTATISRSFIKAELIFIVLIGASGVSNSGRGPPVKPMKKTSSLFLFENFGP
jgi:hypothetical protein